MSIYLPSGLTAAEVLRNEGINVIEGRPDAASWSGLRVGIVNLMPTKEATELALARLVAQAQPDAEIVLIAPGSYEPRHVTREYLARFYRRWPEVRTETFDALIVTGAPVETLPFEEVSYWSEMREIFEWARAHVTTSLYICWAAQAALHFFRGLEKRALPQKAFGVFKQDVLAPHSPLMRGLGGSFPAPVSRHSEIAANALAAPGLEVIAQSQETGACIVADRENRAVCIFDHLEYGDRTLDLEFERDVATGKPIYPPRNACGGRAWQAEAALFYRNWLDLAAKQRAERDAGLAWLFSASAMPSNGRGARLVLQAEYRPHILAEAVACLSSHGFEPALARVHHRNDVLTSVVVDLVQGSADLVERAANSLLAVRGATRVVYRLPGGSGGVLRPRTLEPLACAA
jgi:homoserine O-succinyltransferase